MAHIAATSSGASSYGSRSHEDLDDEAEKRLQEKDEEIAVMQRKIREMQARLEGTAL